MRYPCVVLSVLLAVATVEGSEGDRKRVRITGAVASKSPEQRAQDPARRVVITADAVSVGQWTRTRAQAAAEMRLAATLLAADLLPGAVTIGGPPKPLRHFGPFYFGSPNLRVDGTTARWYFNDYFTNNADSQWFAKYWPALPVNDFQTLSAGQYVPGTMPGPNALNDTLFELARLRWSSRFGGSGELLFQTREDNEFDVRGGEQQVAGAGTVTTSDDVYESLAWDVSLQMSVYVTPVKEAINAAQNNSFSSNYLRKTAEIVFTATNATAYVVRRRGANPLELLRATDPAEHRSELVTVLQGIAEQLGGLAPFWDTGGRFVHGYLHAQLHDELGSANIVDNVDVSDEFLDLYTRAGNPTVFVMLRVDRYSLNAGDQEAGGEEISAVLAMEHIFATGPGVVNTTVSRDFSDLDHGEGTPRRTYGVFLATAAGLPTGLIASVSTTEEDPVSNDEFEPEFFNIPWDPSNLINRAANGPYGEVDRTRQIGFLFRGNVQTNPDGSQVFDDLHGTFGFESQVMLLLR